MTKIINIRLRRKTYKGRVEAHKLGLKIWISFS